MVKEDSAELAHVIKNKAAFGLEKDEVVVFVRDVMSGPGGEPASHAKVDAEPGVAAESKEHLFAAGFGAPQKFTGKRGRERIGIRAAENALLGV